MSRTCTRVVLLVGLPRAGKTTIANKLRRDFGAVIISPDQIRYALHGQRFFADAELFVWAIAACMVRALIYSGHDFIIIDATNNTKKRRNQWINPLWKTLFIPVPTPVEVCLERASGDDVLQKTIARMYNESEPLEAFEQEQLYHLPAENFWK